MKNKKNLKQLHEARNNAIQEIELKAKSILSDHQSVEDLIRDTESRLTESIIDKSIHPINRLITLMAYLFGGVSALGVFFVFFFTDNLKDTLRSHFKEQIQVWLSFENEDSQVADILEDYRTRSLLDSFIIKRARIRSSNTSNIRLELKEKDKLRLLNIIKDPKSKYFDFHDALTILAENRPAYGVGLFNDSVAKTIRKLFEDKTLQPDRLLNIMTIMEKDVALIYIAEDNIRKEQSSEEIRFRSFKMLTHEYARSSPEQQALAMSYAQEKLTNETDDMKLNHIIKYVVKNNPLSGDLKNYRKRIETFDHNERMEAKINLLSELTTWLPNKNHFEGVQTEHRDTNAVRKIITELFLDVVENESRLSMYDHFDNEYIGITFRRTEGNEYFNTIENLDDFLSDRKLMNLIISESKKKGIPYQDIFAFFSLRFKGQNVVSIGFNLSKDSKIKTKTNGELAQGTVWFRERRLTQKPYWLWIDEFSVRHEFEIEKTQLPNLFDLVINSHSDFIYHVSRENNFVL